MPVLTHSRVACLALLAATAVSAAFQAYRTSVGAHPGVDRFGVDMAVNYLILVGLALAVRSDRRVVWWVLTVGMTALLVYAVVGYYPEVYRARPMDRVDWLEGTVFTALLALVLAVAVLRLTGGSLVTTMRDEREGVRSAAP